MKFLIVGIVVLEGVQSYLEFLALTRSVDVDGLWRGMVVVAIINILYLVTVVCSRSTYLVFLVYLFPVIPASYIVVKAVTYYLIQRSTHIPLHWPWAVAFLFLFVQFAMTQGAGRALDAIPPAEEAPSERDLMNRAIRHKDAAALEKLIAQGADPRESYSLTGADPDMAWRIIRWKVEKRVTQERLGDGFQLATIVLNYTADDLKDLYQRGYTLTGEGLVTVAIARQRTRSTTSGFLPEEIHELKEKIRLLVEHGANINGFDADGVNPMFKLIGAIWYTPEVLEYVIEKGGDVNLRSQNRFYGTFNQAKKGDGKFELQAGLTPLMVAAALEPRFVPILVKHGADKTAVDEHGWTALDYAKKRKADRHEWELPAEDSEATLRLLAKME